MGQTYLDTRYCLEQNLRKLISDDAPLSSQLYGTDVELAVFGLGRKLFCDRERMHTTFIAADLTWVEQPSVQLLHGKMNIISA